MPQTITTATWQAETELTAATSNVNDEVGRSVAIHQEWAVVGAPFDDDVKLNSGAVYIYQLHAGSWTEIVKLTPANGGRNDNFGASVAIHQDILIVGAPGNSSAAKSAGAVYVYRWDGSSWTHQATLTASDAAANDGMGNSVALYGVNIVAGAPYDDDNGKNSGSAYIFTLSNGSWTQQAKLTPSDGQKDDNFGMAVALNGDTVLIGVPFEDAQGSNAGAAYAFTRTGSSWSQQAKLTASDGSAGDRFGSSVALFGNQAAIGAPLEDEQGADAGAIYPFSRSGSSWSQGTKITADAGAAGDQFGAALSLRGDFLLAGAPLSDSNGSDAGAGYLYRLTSSGWILRVTLEGTTGDQMATAVSVSGNRLLLGAPLADGSATGDGAAVLYLDSIPVDFSQDWLFEGNNEGANMGYSLALAGDVNGDGFDDALAGAVFYSNGETNEGYVALFYGSPDGWNATPDWSMEGNAANAILGYAVGKAGDLNGDGYADIAVSARGIEQVYIFYGAATGISATPNLTLTGSFAGQRFGQVATTAGDVDGDGYDDLLVTSSRKLSGGPLGGHAFLFPGSANGLIITPTWTVESPFSGDWYGYAARAAGDVNDDGYDDVIIGNPGHEVGGVKMGGAYLHLGSATGLIFTPTVMLDSGQANSQMGTGTSVSGAGDVDGDGYDDLIVGAQSYDNGELNEGQAFFYNGVSSGVTIIPSWTFDGDQDDGAYGWSVGAGSDLNLDGYADFLVGDDEYDNAYFKSGRVHLFYGGSAGPSQLPDWVAEGTQTQGRLGHAVATGGDINGDGLDDILASERYYDNGHINEGRVSAFVATLPMSVTMGGGWMTTTIAYHYDGLYRLTEATYTGGIAATYQYIYDQVGNMTAYTDTVGVTVTHVTRAFDPANRLITATQSAGTTSYSYDHNGNLLQILPPGSAISTSYGYSQRNMLVTVTQTVSGTTAAVAEYRYDGDNARYQQIDYSSGSPITTTYHNDIVGLSQALLMDDGTTQTANLFGLDLIASDDGANTLTMLPDGLGSVRVEMLGELVSSVSTYEPYGTLLMQTGSSGTTYGYTGEQMDGATGLTYLRARYYNPALRIFLSKDPYSGSVGKPATQNGYNYSNGNPVNYTDPTGFCAEVGDEACWSIFEQIQRIYPEWVDSFHLMAKFGYLGKSMADLSGNQLQSMLNYLNLNSENLVTSLEQTISAGFIGIDALVRYFSTYNGPADVRLEQLLDETALFKSIGLPNTGVQFRINIPGGPSLCSAFEDQPHYNEHWSTDPKNPEVSYQMSHFLTAVGLTYFPLEGNSNIRTLLNASYGKSFLLNIQGNLPSLEDNLPNDLVIALKLIIGHETEKDGDEYSQYQNATINDIDTFLSAVAADTNGDVGNRDKLLSAILNESSGNTIDLRKGNSLEDLRLSLKGVRFAFEIFGGNIISSNNAAQWLKYNLSCKCE